MYPTLEEATAAAEQLIGHEIPAHLRGRRLRSGGATAVVVPEEHLERARELLGPAEDPNQAADVHRRDNVCRNCGADGILWMGKWKAVILTAATVILCIVVRTPYFGAALIAAIVVCGISFLVLPEFRCRRCGYAWSKRQNGDEP